MGCVPSKGYGAASIVPDNSGSIKSVEEIDNAGPDTSVISEKYTLGKVLGRGGFGEVWEAVRKADGNRVAIKIISKLKFPGEEERKNMLTEVELHQRVSGENSHANIVELLEFWEDKSSFYMVLSECEGGELMDALAARKNFSEKIASNYFRQMCQAIAWCHSKLVVHRDLKPENFLLKNKSHDSPLQLADFGLACAIPTIDAVITDPCGSAYYIAPEVFTKAYTRAADVWALGVNLFLLLSGTVPFGANASSEAEVYKSIQRDKLVYGPQWSTISAGARELVSGLLEKDPRKRYTIEQVLAHPWVTGESASDVALDPSLISSIVAFNAKNKLRKMALRLVASNLKAADVAKLRAMFNKIDTDGGGTISYTEMTKALADLGITDEGTIARMMESLDADGDGVLSYEEFLTAVVDRQLVQHQNSMWYAFNKLDIDGDGMITCDELQKYLGPEESPETIAKYIREYDINKDGMIDYEEFLRMLMPKDIRFKIARH